MNITWPTSVQSTSAWSLARATQTGSKSASGIRRPPGLAAAGSGQAAAVTAVNSSAHTDRGDETDVVHMTGIFEAYILCAAGEFDRARALVVDTAERAAALGTEAAHAIRWATRPRSPPEPATRR